MGDMPTFLSGDSPTDKNAIPVDRATSQHPTAYCARCKAVVPVLTSTITVRCTACGRTWPANGRRP